MACLIKIKEFIIRVYGEEGTHPTPQTITRMCRRGEIPAEQIGRLWYVKWDIYQKLTGENLVDKVLRG